MLFILVTTATYEKEHLKRKIRRQPLTSLVSSNLGSLVLIIKIMTSYSIAREESASHLSSKTDQSCQKFSYWFGPKGATKPIANL